VKLFQIAQIPKCARYYFTYLVTTYKQFYQIRKSAERSQLYFSQSTVHYNKSVRPVSPLETKLFLSNNDMLFFKSKSSRTYIRRTKGTVVNVEPTHVTKEYSGSHLHPSGHGTATVPGTISNHNQNAITATVNSSDTITTVSLDGVAVC
jgi:hypothetical protein